MDLSSVLFHGKSPLKQTESNGKEDDDKANGTTNDSNNHDGTLVHAWLFEPEPESSPSSVITDAGLENIANHKYVPGKYTHLDNFLNPMWTYLTSLLPMKLAPNMVTTLGGLHCGLAYLVLWHYSPNFDVCVPSWAIILSGYCTLAYYTLDCMDGKQARRTGTSSPLGQLFDHGFDCICNLAHCANTGGYLMIGGSNWFLLLQSSLQFSFFMAQWEEYYTHVLPHACGNWVGVTEVNYSLGLLSIANAFIDREAFWMRPLTEVLPSSIIDRLPDYIASLELRHAGLSGWFILLSVLMFLSMVRVCMYVENNSVRLSALSKLISPFMLASSLFLFPRSLVETDTRRISLATGLMFSQITKKMIVFSMAKMTFASVQLDVLPWMAVCLWLRYDDNWTPKGSRLILGVMCLWHAYRLVHWAAIAIEQICARLGIRCLTLEKRKFD